jgi:hypothetical protein
MSENFYFSLKLKSMKKIILYTVGLFMLSCGPKEELKICAEKIRKEFDHGGVKGTVENGCFIKYQSQNEVKITGNSRFKVTDGALKTIHLPKGSLISSDGDFVIDADLKEVKVRLVGGSSKAKIGDKEVNLQLNQVMTVGGN